MTVADDRRLRREQMARFGRRILIEQRLASGDDPGRIVGAVPGCDEQEVYFIADRLDRLARESDGLPDEDLVPLALVDGSRPVPDRRRIAKARVDALVRTGLSTSEVMRATGCGYVDVVSARARADSPQPDDETASPPRGTMDS